MEFEEIFQYIGHSGLYQVLVYLLVAFPGIFHGYEALGMIFLGLNQDHFCQVEALQELPYTMQQHIAIPRKDDSYSQCEMFDLPWSSYNFSDFLNWNRTAVEKNANVTSCRKWNYKLSLFTRTLQTEFDLVCGSSWYIQMGSTCYLAGMLVGSFVSGILSDRFGRMKALVVGTALHPIIGLAIAYCPNIQLFCFLRFLLGVAAFTAFLSGYVYVSEIKGPRFRTLGCLAFNCTYSLGCVLNPIQAYFVRDYVALILVMILPVFGTVSYYWVLPESPRWLNASGKKEKAMEVIKLIADVNKKELPEGINLTVNEKKHESHNFLELFCPELRKTTLIDFFLWITNSLLFYGLALNMGSLVGNVFLNAFIASAMDIVATILAGIFAEKVGRKPATFACFFIGGICNLLVIPLIVLQKAEWLLLTLTIIGRAGAYASFCMTYLVTAELFPTQIRQVAMGSCSTCSRFSGVLAPYIGGPLASVWRPLPSLIFGLFGVTSAGLTLLLRETINKPMPDTIEDVRILEKNHKIKPLAEPDNPEELGRLKGLQNGT